MREQERNAFDLYRDIATHLLVAGLTLHVVSWNNRAAGHFDPRFEVEASK